MRFNCAGGRFFIARPGSVSARNPPTHGPPWLWVRADSAAAGGGEGVPLKRPKRAASFGKEAALIRLLFANRVWGEIPIAADQKNMIQQMQQKIEKITGNMTVVTKISQ